MPITGFSLTSQRTSLLARLAGQLNASRARLRGGLCLAVLMLAGCSNLQSGSSCVVSDEYMQDQHSLMWARDHASVNLDPLNAIGPVTLEQIRSELQRQFSAAGYTFTDDPEQADLLVSFVVATHEELLSRMVTHTSPWCWGEVHRPYHTADYATPVAVKEAFLAVDLADAYNNRPLWRGWARKAVTRSDRDDPMPLIGAAVASIIAELPGAVVTADAVP